MNEMQPYINADKVLPEITVKVIIISIILALVLSMSNAYLALRIGMLTSASIPAAILSLGILRFFRHANILENNLIQTAASAGEAVAGGIVYTIPALVLIHYWHHFPYWQCMLIALTSGMLGVFFSIPLRRILVNDKTLRFPEGKAIAEVLIVGTDKQFGLRQILTGGLLGGVIELLQTGFKLVSNQWQWWFASGRSIMGVGLGFSPTMIGAGYLIGFDVGLTIFMGAFFAWFIGVPILSYGMHIAPQQDYLNTVMSLWQSKIRYIGVGAMIVAGFWTLLTLLKPVGQGLVAAIKVAQQSREELIGQLRTDRDMPIIYVAIGSILFLMLMYFLLEYSLPVGALNLGEGMRLSFVFYAVIYTAILGFIVSAITSYFSGLVGVSASPGASVLIACLLITSLILRALLHNVHIPHEQLIKVAAIPIFLGAILTGIGAIANDNIQDLKVGQLVGATPWKQQAMLLLGVVIASLVIPVVMELLFNVYGIGDVLPQANMDPSQALPAPPAAMMAAVTQGVFNYKLPWDMVIAGGVMSVLAIVAGFFLKANGKRFPVLAFAVGMYLPLATSMALFVGSIFAKLVKSMTEKSGTDDAKLNYQKTVIFACGLVAGSAIMDIVLAAPFAMAHNANLFKLAPAGWGVASQLLGGFVTLFLGYYFVRVAKKS